MAYASKYYDPVKAHEYYMKNRELKGYANRYGGARGDGTSAASGYTGTSSSTPKRESLSTTYQKISDRYQSQREASQKSSNSVVDSYRQLLKNETEKTKQTISYGKNYYDSQIKGIQSTIQGLMDQRKGLSTEEKKARKEEFKRLIAAQREKIKKLRAEKKAFATKMREELKNTRKIVQAKIKEIRKKQKIDRLNSQNKERAEKRKAYLADRAAKLDEADANYEARSKSQKSGSTSGFNEKGRAAAEYVKTQMQKEHETNVENLNKKIDEQMLQKAESLRNKIEMARKSGWSINRDQYRKELEKLIKDTKKMKDKEKAAQSKAFREKYELEIDKIRNDKSMHSYYDRRAEKVSRYAEQDRLYDEKESRRIQKQKASR